MFLMRSCVPPPEVPVKTLVYTMVLPEAATVAVVCCEGDAEAHVARAGNGYLEIDETIHAVVCFVLFGL